MTLALTTGQIGTEIQQDVFLFPERFEKTLLMGNWMRQKKKLLAVKLAHLEQVIDQMPEGLETVIGERGSNFLVVKSNG